jgi:hypothetical protein
MKGIKNISLNHSIKKKEEVYIFITNEKRMTSKQSLFFSTVKIDHHNMSIFLLFYPN